MRWRGRRQSVNVEDRRGFSGARLGIGGGLGGLLLLILYMVLGGDPGQLMQQLPQSLPADGGEPASGSYVGTPEEEEQRAMVATILADTEEGWQRIFAERGSAYEPPHLVLFTGAVQSACGFAESAVGPFYCPANDKVYLDLGFFRELGERFGAPGDFAQAYVVAHEVGHHVQNLLGIAEQVQAAQARAGGEAANELSVRFELQADCLAGVWAHGAGAARELLEAGDLEEGLTAASAIGDDRIQLQQQGYVAPESFTHGSSEQRVSWFRRGFEHGQLEACETFR